MHQRRWSSQKKLCFRKYLFSEYLSKCSGACKSSKLGNTTDAIGDRIRSSVIQLWMMKGWSLKMLGPGYAWNNCKSFGFVSIVKVFVHDIFPAQFVPVISWSSNCFFSEALRKCWSEMKWSASMQAASREESEFTFIWRNRNILLQIRNV